MRMTRGGLAFALVLAACSGAERPSATATQAVDSAALAEDEFSPAAFDTVNWKGQEERVERGRVVWQFSCSKCHGLQGKGDGEAAAALGVKPPSLVAPDWRLANDVPGLRHQIFVGTGTGMPNWGLHGLKPRDIDAVAAFIVNVLHRATG
ncbi:MAG: cytochrome c [Gemmatimonadetes bacterium]|nr:cytochrome c [Gemmatimonadota bacterium]